MNDLISRQAVEEIINDIRDCISVEGYWAIFERMKKLPPVTPQPKTGHWIYTGYVCQTDEIIYGYGCSKCGAISFFRKSDNKILGGKWCHYCGAGMVEPQESEIGMSEEISREEIAALLARESEEQE